MEFAGALQAIAEGKVDLAPWLTGTVGVDGVPQAFADLANPEQHAKILVVPGPDEQSVPVWPRLTDPSTMSDTFPRQYARTQRLTLGEPAQPHRVARRAARRLRCAAAAATTRSTACGCSTSPPARSAWSATRSTLLGAHDDENLPRRGAAAPRAHARGRRRHHGVRHRRRRARSPRSRSPGGCSSPGCSAGRRASSSSTVRCSTRAPIRWPPVSPTSAGAALRIAELDGSSWELAGDERPPTSPGAAPTSSPPRRWTASAATGGAPTAPRSRPAGSTSAPCSAGTSATLRTPTSRPTRSRYPAAGTTNADVTLHVLRARRRQHARWCGTATPTRTSPTWSGPTRTRLLLTVQSRDQRSLMVLEADPATATPTRCSPTATPPGSSSCRARRPLLADGQLVMCADRDGARRLLVDGEPVTPADLQVRAGARGAGRRGVLPRQPDRRRHRAARVAVAHRRHARGAHRRARRAHRRRSAAPRWCCAAAVLDEPGADHPGARRAGASPSLVARAPLVRPNVSLHHYGAAPPRHRRAAAPARRTTARRCRCCSTRTAARTRSGCCSAHNALPHLAVVRRPGLRRRRHRRSRHARAAAASGSAPCTTTSPRCRSTTRSTRCTPRRSSTRSTSAGSPSAGGASAATSPRSPCCVGPTSSTRPSPAHPSPSGGCTTRTTPSATSATRASTPTPYAASSLLPLADELTRPLLLVHGLADDNVVAAHTLAALERAAGRRQAARGAAARGRHPHDPAGGGGREPAAAPARRSCSGRSVCAVATN